ncbi:malonyl-ACP O-methyltransferase BioC [Spongorhabdus nitratireducens]
MMELTAAPDSKNRIAANFSRAADTYDAAATLQERVARHVLNNIPALPECSHILDLGSGTGHQTAQLASRFPEAQIIGLDMAMGMLQHAYRYNHNQNRHWCAGDIDHLPFKANSFDLAFSSLAIQWCDSLNHTLQQVSRILKPGGYFIFSSLAAGSMKELQQSWRQVDQSMHVNRYESFDVQQHRIMSGPLQTEILECSQEVLYYPDTLTLLRELKALGVNTVLKNKASGLTGRKRLQQLQAAYETFREADGLPSSWQVIYGVLRKPEFPQ